MKNRDKEEEEKILVYSVQSRPLCLAMCWHLHMVPNYTFLMFISWGLTTVCSGGGAAAADEANNGKATKKSNTGQTTIHAIEEGGAGYFTTKHNTQDPFKIKAKSVINISTN